MKKGRVAINKLILGIVAVVVLIIVIMGVTGQFNKFYFWADLFPSFEEDFPEGEAILGYNLLNSRLYYYTGTKWKEIDTSNEVFVLGDYEFNPGGVRDGFENFYNGERRPSEPVWQTINFRLWSISRLSSFSKRARKHELAILRFEEHPLPNYEGEKTYVDEFGYSYSLDSFKINYQDSIEEYGMGIVEGFALPREGKYFQNVYQPTVERGVAWRDQFLKGKECEKFFRIDDINLDYVVDRTGEYLHVELTEPVYPGTPEKWQDEECFSVPEIEDVSNWVNSAKVEIKFHPDGKANRVHTISWESNKGWFYIPENKRSVAMHLDGLPDSEYLLTREQQQDFYEGLRHFSGAHPDLDGVDDYFGMIDGSDDENIEVYMGVGNSLEKKDLNYGGLILMKDGSLNDDPLRALKFTDFVTTEYNKYLLPPADETIEITEPTEYDFDLYTIVKHGNLNARLIYYDGEYSGFFISSLTHISVIYFGDPESFFGHIFGEDSYPYEVGEVREMHGGDSVIERIPTQTYLAPPGPLTYESIGHIYSLEGKILEEIPVIN